MDHNRCYASKKESRQQKRQEEDRLEKTSGTLGFLDTTYSKPEGSHKELKGKERQMKKGSSKAHLNVVIKV